MDFSWNLAWLVPLGLTTYVYLYYSVTYICNMVGYLTTLVSLKVTAHLYFSITYIINMIDY
jgi:hypothetical protein